MPKYTFDQIRDAALIARDGMPKDFRYADPNWYANPNDSTQIYCHYTVAEAATKGYGADDNRLKTGCLVGTIFSGLGEDVSGWKGSIWNILRKRPDFVDSKTSRWLIKLQYGQDGGSTWAEAITSADKAARNGAW